MAGKEVGGSGAGAVWLFLLFLISLLSGAVVFSSGNARAAVWTVEVVDSAGDVGLFSDLALDDNGNPRITHYDFNNDRVLYSEWTGSMWLRRTVGDAGSYGTYGLSTALALDSAGRPHISYYYSDSATSGELRYATWTGSAWSISTVDSSGDVGLTSDIVIDGNDWPRISYYDLRNGNLKYARWTGSVWSLNTADSVGDVGLFTSMVLDSGGDPHISYRDVDGDWLRYAVWTGASWSRQTVDATGTYGGWSSIALDGSDSPGISYYYSETTSTGSLRYAEWTGVSWNLATVDAGGDVGGSNSLALDADGYGRIGYYDYGNGDLKYARWDGGMWNLEIVDSSGDVGGTPSLAVDARGSAHITYYDIAWGDLKYARETVAPSPPDTPATPSGPGWGHPGTWYTYSTSTSDPNGDPLTYTFDWGDGNRSSVGPVPSGTPVSLSNAWGAVGTYSVTAMAVDDQGLPSAWSAALVVTMDPLNTPGPPETPIATALDQGVDLSWNPPADDGGLPISGYAVYRGTSPGAESLLVQLGTVLSYADRGLTNGQTVYYQITARNSAYEGPRSVEVNATPATVPGSPTGLTAARGNAAVQLSWAAPASDGGMPITNYTVYRGTVSGGGVAIADIGTSLSFSDTGLTNGQRYLYQVTARNSVGEGPRSDEVEATPATTPSSPIDLRVVPGDRQATLAWSVPSSNGGSPITGYRIYRGETESALVPIDDTTSLTYTDAALVNGRTYYYRVSAMNGAGEGPTSTAVLAIPTAPPVYTQAWFWIVIALVIVAIAALAFYAVRRGKLSGQPATTPSQATAGAAGSTEGQIALLGQAYREGRISRELYERNVRALGGEPQAIAPAPPPPGPSTPPIPTLTAAQSPSIVPTSRPPPPPPPAATGAPPVPPVPPPPVQYPQAPPYPPAQPGMWPARAPPPPPMPPYPPPPGPWEGPPQARGRFCVRCGRPALPSAGFCGVCGAPLP